MGFLQSDHEGGFTVISRAAIARICGLAFIALMFFGGLIACRVEPPEVQIVPEATVVATAVATLPQTPMASVPEMIPIAPTLTPFLRPTVRDFIIEANLSPAGLDTDILDQRIIAFEPLNSERSFLLGYFIDEPTQSELGDELHFLKFDKTAQVWLTTVLATEPERPESLDNEPCPPTICYRLGVPLYYQETPLFYYVYTHLNPSAGWTAILTPNLELNTVLFGQVQAFFNDGTAVYSEGNIHFAPTHYALVSIYDPESKESQRIFPREPYQALWQARQQLVAETYESLGEAWCRENGHHCLAELFNNYLTSEVIVNDQTDSLLFIVAFVGELLVDLPEEEVIYVYRGIRENELEFRETNEATLTELFGSYELADLLEPAALERIFTEVVFTENSSAD